MAAMRFLHLQQYSHRLNLLYVFDVEYIYVSFDGGSASKVDDITACRAIQDGGYVLTWQRYDNNKMAAMRFLHLQQYSHRLNLFYFYLIRPA